MEQGMAGAICTHWLWPAKARVGAIRVDMAVVGSGVHVLFFFQAEDGIRDKLVTGVQTCALPISERIERLGQWREALDALGQALAIARERRAGLQMEAQLLTHLARTQLGLGDAATARVTAEEAIAVARHRGTRTFEIEAHIVLGRVLIHAGARREEV